MIGAVPQRIRRFATVGVANTLIDLALFALMHHALGIVLANFLSTSAGMTFSFLVNGRFTFGHDRRTLRQAVLFVATTGSTMWVLQPVLIDTLTQLGVQPMMLAKVVGLGGSVVANYLMYHYVVWPRAGVSREPQPAGLVAAPVAARR